ncbi:hypothetical protein F5Y19DRAFT_476344 [Xylariaceae sp. FL1651]|nr:hypothetical protein F5Y19DRAFT_476344 [Xylariaceae sp. FL1651]
MPVPLCLFARGSRPERQPLQQIPRLWFDVILEITGNPAAEIRHAVLCCEHMKHIVMINVETNILPGSLLLRKAKEARKSGFNFVCASKGTKHLPEYQYSNPATVWNYYDSTNEQLATGDFNLQMFDSSLDGTKSSLEMAAVTNGCNLIPPSNTLKFSETQDCRQLRIARHTGGYATQHKPYHLISLELGVSGCQHYVPRRADGTDQELRHHAEAGHQEGLGADVEYNDKLQAIAVRKELEALFKKESAASKTNGVNSPH